MGVCEKIGSPGDAEMEVRRVPEVSYLSSLRIVEGRSGDIVEVDGGFGPDWVLSCGAGG